MKNVFVTLTSRNPDGSASDRVAINMSRVQEIWPTRGGCAKLIMNIPDCTVMVMESVDVILQKLDDANREPTALAGRGGARG